MSNVKDSVSVTDNIDISIKRGNKQPEVTPDYKPHGIIEVEPTAVTYPVDFNIKNNLE